LIAIHLITAYNNRACRDVARYIQSRVRLNTAWLRTPAGNQETLRLHRALLVISSRAIMLWTNLHLVGRQFPVNAVYQELASRARGARPRKERCAAFPQQGGPSWGSKRSLQRLLHWTQAQGFTYTFRSYRVRTRHISAGQSAAARKHSIRQTWVLSHPDDGGYSLLGCSYYYDVLVVSDEYRVCNITTTAAATTPGPRFNLPTQISDADELSDLTLPATCPLEKTRDLALTAIFP
jgi:hypothetical protein